MADKESAEDTATDDSVVVDDDITMTVSGIKDWTL